MPPSDPHPPRPLRRLRNWLLSLGLVVALAACGFLGIAALLVRQAPAWWRTTDPDDPATIRAGEEVENGVVNVMYQLRDDPARPWMVTLHAADANAWLNTRLTQWLVNADPEFEWPSDIENVQVQFDEGLIQIGVRVGGVQRPQIVSATLRPEVRNDGSLWVAAQSVSVGRLPIPAAWVVDRAPAAAARVVPQRALEDPETLRLLRALAGENALESNPVVDLGDGRRVRLLRLSSKQGRLLVQCRTEYCD